MSNTIPNTLEALVAQPDIIAVAEVQCHYPCVPECTRNHTWNEDNK